jgi:hypothetical protein
MSIRGRAQPYLINPLGFGSGIEPVSNLRENNIQGSKISVNSNSSFIEIEDIVSGIYTLQLKNVYSEDFYLNISFSDTQANINHKFHGFIAGDTVSFIIQVDLALENKITILHEPQQVIGLQAQVTGASELTTKLEWQLSGNENVAHYNIYHKEYDQPYFSLLTSTSDNFFNTIHPWVISSAIKAKLYAVSAVLQDGTESFLSDTVTNNDRDYDGLTDETEITLNTLVDNPDSDGDGMLDGQETNRGTNPMLPDTDGDTFSDTIEENFGSDPLNIESIPLIIKEDFNRDGNINLDDSQLGLKVMTHYEATVDSTTDVNGDEKIDLKDILYILRHIGSEQGGSGD